MYKLPVNYCFLIPTTILLFLLPYFSQAQNTKGTVLDANTKLPVAFASIYQLKTTKGTITNSNGEFNIPISNKGEIEIRISCIGYKTLFQKLTFNKNKVVIFLTPDEASLQEVVVMPDSLLKTILKKSYQNISSNYAQSPMELTGFYREVQKSTTDDHFLYFGEALLKVQQKGYNHPNEDAQIEILKSRIINFPHSDSIDNVKYYRGPFIPQWGDFVRNRSNFLNPNSFNKTYIYHLDAITTYNNKEDSVYVIRFSSKKPSDKKSGKIWINKKTFAYLKIEFNNQTHEKPQILIPIRYLSRNYIAIYSEIGGKYFLKYASASAHKLNEKTQKESFSTAEFATTNYSTRDSISPIPLENRIGYLSIFSMQKNNYDDSFWDSYSFIEKDSSLKKQTKIHYSINDAKSIVVPSMSNKSSQKEKTKFNLYTTIQKLHFSYNISLNQYLPIGQQSYQFVYDKNLLSNKNFKNSFFPVYTNSLGFDISKRSTIEVRTYKSILKDNYFYGNQLNFKYTFLIKKLGNPLFIKPFIGTGAFSTGFYLGEISSEETIKIDNQNFGTKTNAYLGDRKTLGILGFELDYSKKRLHYLFTFQYTPTIVKWDAILLKTRKNIFITKTAAITDLSGSFQLQPQNIYQGMLPIAVSVGIGF